MQHYSEHLCWIFTHLTGPNKHFQVIYKIPPARLKLLADKLKVADFNPWKLLAKPREKEFSF